jgi:hypothetical protein
VAAEPFYWERQGRNPVTLYTVVGTWATLLALLILVEASPTLMGVLALFTLPAVWELYANPTAGMRIDADTLHWFSGKRKATLDWAEVTHVRLDTRLDFSVRATAMLTAGRKVRLPYECTPPDQLLEAVLNAHGVRTERHHFSLIG